VEVLSPIRVEQFTQKVVIFALSKKVMYPKYKNKAVPSLALLLMAVFVIAVGFKPAHVLFAGHHYSTVKGCEHKAGEHSDQETISNQHDESCPVCEFEFCLFVPQNQFNLPQLVVNLEEKLTSRIFSCLVHQASHHFQLRAPPSL
jgi:hypothetical protein